MHRAAAVILLSLLLAACAIQPATEPVDVLLLGEQHDAPSHQEQHRQAVQALADQGALAALALEMAEQGRSTAGLARDATPAAVQAALQWNDKAWPWAAYGPAVLAAVRAGVPVLGANLPRSSMRTAMGDATLDRLLSPAALQAQQTEIRSGHCGLLPETQILPMTRIQLARDRTMAQVLAQAAVPGKTVVLLAGAGHVEPALGVPQHLSATLRVRAQRWPAQPPQKDYCEELRRQMAPAK
ncbi:ChaN family lipoprotein [uncultured Ramlibacter sp.]|uniref:ChaN family lipoprotein n=1 Tax=uncultured Ramlibacter sp. TaxID=260755 RepID=UPI0026236265|nr:ChaN family lipoprotein [uncultured Ramlibacter sp.]